MIIYFNEYYQNLIEEKKKEIEIKYKSMGTVNDLLELFKIHLELKCRDSLETFDFKKWNINQNFIILYNKIYDFINLYNDQYTLKDIGFFIKNIFDHRIINLNLLNNNVQNEDDINNLYKCVMEFINEIEIKHGDQFYFQDPSMFYELYDGNKHYHLGERNEDCQLVSHCIIPAIYSRFESSIVSKGLVIATKSVIDLDSLPLEIVIAFLSSLPSKDLFSFSMTSHKYRDLINQYGCWNTLFKRVCPDIVKSLDISYHHTLTLMFQVYNYKPKEEIIWMVLGIRSFKRITLKWRALKLLYSYVSKMKIEDFMDKLSKIYHEFVHFIVSMIQDNFNVVEIVRVALEILNIVFKDKMFENIKTLVSKKIHLMAIFCLKKYEQDVDVQMAGFRILKRIASDNQLRPALVKDGIFEVMVKSLKINSQHTCIVDIISQLFRNLAFNETLHKSFETDQSLIKVIVKTMQLPNVSKIALIELCITLNNICQNKKLSKLIHKRGGIKVLCDLLKTSDDIDVKTEVINNFTNLSYFSLNNRLSIYRKGTLKFILKEMREHPLNEALQNNCYHSLNNLSFTICITKKIAKSEAIELLGTAATNFPQSADKYNHLVSCLVDLNNGII